MSTPSAPARRTSCSGSRARWPLPKLCPICTHTSFHFSTCDGLSKGENAGFFAVDTFFDNDLPAGVAKFFLNRDAVDRFECLVASIADDNTFAGGKTKIDFWYGNSGDISKVVHWDYWS